MGNSSIMTILIIVTLLIVNLIFLILYNSLQKANEEYLALQLSMQKEQADIAYYSALQEQFENQLALELYKMDLNKKIWLEDESGSIGKVRIPRTLWKQMQSTEVIEVQTDNKERIDFLVDEYGPLNKDFLIESTLHIQKRLGSDHAKNAVEAIKENRMSDFIEIVLVYYDKAYRRCLAKRDEKSVHSLEIEYENPEKAAVQVLNFAKDKSLI